MLNPPSRNNRFAQLKIQLAEHMPRLDGLRGLAILWVIFHNAGMKEVDTSEGMIIKLIELIASTGWIGVQLFFVLSGFLITGILLDGRGSKRQLPNFYMRRILRIFPLYYIFLILVFVVIPTAGLMPDWLESSHDKQLWYWLYIINWTQPFFDELAFGHFWSLAIEEQFYIFWPLLVVFLRLRTLVFICMGLVVSAPLIRLFMIQSYPDIASDIAYTFTIARWDALAIGGLLAIAVRNQNAFEKINAYSLRIVILLLICVSAQILVNHEFAPVSGHWGAINQSIAAVLSAALIFNSLSSTGVLTKSLSFLFSSNFLRLLGKYSYSMYIVHIPIKFIWFSTFAFDPSQYHRWEHLGVLLLNFIAIFLLTLAVSIATWYLIEKPFLGFKRFFNNQ